jgi:hypothetical protein
MDGSVYDFYPQIPRGDTLRLLVTCRRKNFTLISPVQAFFTVKRYADDPNPPLIAKSAGSGITIDGYTALTVVPAAEVLGLAAGSYYYDFVVVEADGTRSTLLQGKFPVKGHPLPS